MRQLAELSGLESEEKQLAAAFLIEKLQTYMGENESLKLQIEELEGEISLSRNERSQIQRHNPEELQRLRDELTELKQNDGKTFTYVLYISFQILSLFKEILD